MPYYPEFGQLITTYLNEQERSASWLATRLGVHPSTVINWQNGANRPKGPEQVIRVADMLGIHTPAAQQALLTAAGYAYVVTAANPPPVPIPVASGDEQVTPAGRATETDDVLADDPPIIAEAEMVTLPPAASLEAVPTIYDLLRTWQVRTQLKKGTTQLAAYLREVTTWPWVQSSRVWAVIGVLNVGLWLGLTYPLLWEWPLARRWVVEALALTLLGMLAIELRRPGVLLRKLRRITSDNYRAKICTFCLCACGLLVWLSFGLPRLYGKWPYPGVDEDGDHYGYALASGDYNGDGYTDLAIGTPGETIFANKLGERSGWVYTFNGANYNIQPSVNFGQAGLDFNRDGDRFGWVFATGDFNHDDIPDLAIGAPGKTIGNTVHTGCVYIFKGTRQGLAPWQVLDQHLLGHNATGAQFGWSLAVGDFNHDGIDDLAVGAPYKQPGDGLRTGYVFVFTGGAQGFTQYFGLHQAGVVQPQQDARFGWALAAGDFEHNGKIDLAVGAPGVRTPQGAVDAPTGRVYLFRMLTEKGPILWQELAPIQVTGQPASNRFGAALLSADFDVDGWPDLVIGAPGDLLEASTMPQTTGAVDLFKNTHAGFAFWQELHQTPPTSDANVDLFGWALAAGDFDRDGQIDLAVGAPGEGVGNSNEKRKSGAAYTFKNTHGRLALWQKFTEPDLGRDQFNDHFGWSVATGNFDHDGIDDLAIGAPGGAPGLHWVAGLVYLYRTAVDGLDPWMSLYEDMHN